MEIVIPQHSAEKAGKDWKGFLITRGLAGLSVLLMAPADIVEVFSWFPKRLLHLIPSGSPFWTFMGLCEITVGLADRFSLFFALVLNIVLLFRKQTPVWLKILVWALFLVAVLGAVGVETELIHVRHIGERSSHLGTPITLSTRASDARS
jgi:hypothetical protein